MVKEAEESVGQDQLEELIDSTHNRCQAVISVITERLFIDVS